jgi:hypothetical protein
MWHSSVESPIMLRNRDGGPLWAEPMKAASEPSLLGERLRPLKQLAMNSRLSKRTVSSREKPPHDRCSSSVAMASIDEGTIGTSKGKACCKSLFLPRQLLVFSAPTIYRMVKIARSSSEVVL